MSKGQKHHYIPEFYLKQWGDPNNKGQLYEYCRRYKGVEIRPTYPGGTGYEHGLYNFSELDPESRNFLEDKFLLKADDGASAALQLLLKRDLNLNRDLRSAWSRFIMTLMYRSPETIHRLRSKIAAELPSTLNQLKDDWEKARRKYDPISFEEYAASIPRRDIQQATLILLHKIMDSERVGGLLNSMTWGVLTFNQLRFPLLTSDRPYVMTNGLSIQFGHIVLPISPDSIFIATKDANTMRQLHAHCENKKLRMAEKLNDIIACQSRKFVWGNTATQLHFVSKRLGKKRKSSPLD